MSTIAMQTGFSWSTLHEEDRRFRRILLQTLAVSLVAGAITPYIRIPLVESEAVEEAPVRRVRLLPEQFTPAPVPTELPAAPEVAAPPVPKTALEQLPVAPTVTPRETAARAGVLAMSDALADLRGTTPKTGTASRQQEAVGQVQSRTSQASMLTANVTRGSRGIEGGVAHQSVLGATGLPDREAGDHNFAGREGVAMAGRQTSAAASGAVRTEEDIQEVLDRHKGAMYTLYNHELRKDASLQGKLVISLTIAPEGTVSRCVILNSDLGADSLEQQLVALIKRIDFGNKPGVPAVTTKVPIEFFPR
jgi:protein TonB